MQDDWLLLIVSAVTKYYYAGASRLAMSVNGTASNLLPDQLGSTALHYMTIVYCF